MDYNFKKELEQIAAYNAKQKSILENAEAEGRTALNESEEQEFDRLHKLATDIEIAIERKKEVLAKEAKTKSILDEFAEINKKSVEQVVEDKEKFDKAFVRFVMLGKDGISNEEREIISRAQSTTNSAGGYTIPTTLANEIIKGMAAFGGMRENSRILSTAGGETFKFAYNDDTAGTVELITEGNAITADDDTTFSEVSLGAYKYGQAVYINYELAQDSQFDIVGHITELFSDRFGRGLNAIYTNADGSSKPNGVMNATSAGVTLADQDAITYDEILELKHSVDPAYRRNGKFMLNDSTLLAIKKLSIGSGDARPLWQAGMAAGEPATIDGSQYFINQDVDSLGSLKKPMAYGDFSKFIIRDAGAMRMIRDTSLRVLQDQITLVGWHRTDSDLLDSRAIKHMATLTNT